VQQALAARQAFLLEQGFAERRGQRVVPIRNLLATLRSREIESAGKALEAETGLTHHDLVEGERVSGVYRRTVQLANPRIRGTSPSLLERSAGLRHDDDDGERTGARVRKSLSKDVS